MTKSFERFLHSLSDEDLVAFARDRDDKRPPYWRVLQVALRIELGRRGLILDEGRAEAAFGSGGVANGA